MSTLISQVSRVVAKPVDATEAADAETIENSLQLYTGPLTEGFYDDWVLCEQGRLRCLCLNGLAQVMQYYKHHKAYWESLTCG